MKRVYKNHIINKLGAIIISFLILNFSFLITLPLQSQQSAKYFKVEVKKKVELECKFLLYLPQGYDTIDRQWPLLLFLHGAEEAGNMMEMVKKNGPPKMIEYGYQFPFIVISPQSPSEDEWSLDVLNMLLNEMVSRYKVDTNRIYVTGLSMGGTATWNLAIAYPQRFAAVVPICGRADPSKAALIKDLPVWVFHGALDDIVPLEIPEKMVNALKELGSPVKFTVYPDGGHDAWTETYYDPEFWAWLMEQHR
jgi:predicted peptidase